MAVPFIRVAQDNVYLTRHYVPFPDARRYTPGCSSRKRFLLRGGFELFMSQCQVQKIPNTKMNMSRFLSQETLIFKRAAQNLSNNVLLAPCVL